jgi:hypothetical protein
VIPNPPLGSTWQELITELQGATYQFGVIERGSPVARVHFDAGLTNEEVTACDYLRCEFGLPNREKWPKQVRPIRFWDVDRFQSIRWSDGPCVFDNSKGLLPPV